MLSKSLLETDSRQTPQITFQKSCHHKDRIRISLKVSSLHYNTMLYIFTLLLLHPSITTASHKSTLMERRWKRKPTKALCRIPIVGTEFGLDLNRGGSRAYQGGQTEVILASMGNSHAKPLLWTGCWVALSPNFRSKTLEWKRFGLAFLLFTGI